MKCCECDQEIEAKCNFNKNREIRCTPCRRKRKSALQKEARQREGKASVPQKKAAAESKLNESWNEIAAMAHEFELAKEPTETYLIAEKLFHQ